MAAKETGRVTIVMPIYNGATTLEQVFVSLEKQQHKEVVERIIIIDDHSSDTSEEIINTYAKASSYTIHTITHESSQGLAANYNEGIRLATTDFVITMHQDIVLTDQESFVKMLEPFEDS